MRWLSSEENISKKTWQNKENCNPLYDKDFSFLCFLMKMPPEHEVYLKAAAECGNMRTDAG